MSQALCVGMYIKTLTWWNVYTDDCHKSQNKIKSDPQQNKMYKGQWNPVTYDFVLCNAIDNRFRYNPHKCDLKHSNRTGMKQYLL